MKFSDTLAHYLYEVSLEHESMETQGSLADNGRIYNLFESYDAPDGEVIHAILVEDDTGFVVVDLYPSKEVLLMEWDSIARELDEERRDYDAYWLADDGEDDDAE